MHKGTYCVKYAVITVSDSRYDNQIILKGKNHQHFSDDITNYTNNPMNDKLDGIYEDLSGNYLKKELDAKVHALIPDNKDMLKGIIDHLIDYFDIDCIVITGGTGISYRDNTPDVLKKLYDKELDGFKIIFHTISYKDVGFATILSRSSAGIYRNKLIYSIPGSLNACKTAINIIKNQSGHIIKHLNE
jgi:molybdenum cofactor biosynthesis protein B